MTLNFMLKQVILAWYVKEMRVILKLPMKVILKTLENKFLLTLKIEEKVELQEKQMKHLEGY